MNATELLMQEHRLILSYVGLLERYAALSEQAVFLGKAACFIEFIHEFADSFHHAKEEESLFRFLGQPGVLTHCNPVPQMLLEHTMARQLLTDMETALAAKNPRALADKALQYARLLTEHIFKEDNILYPMAERGLSEQDKSLLLEEYAATEQRLQGQLIRDKFEALYIELQAALEV